MKHEYQTIAGPAEGEFKDKGSKFIAYAYPIESEDDVKFYQEEVRALHPKARHHCYAYRIGLDESRYRANDDGEPAGSAGRPILNTLLSADLSDILVIVVRYFGGTLLGVPGLINAYKEATKEAIAAAEITSKILRQQVVIWYGVEHSNAMMQLAKKLDTQILEQRYEDRCGLVLAIRQSHIPMLKEALAVYWDITLEEE